MAALGVGGFLLWDNVLDDSGGAANPSDPNAVSRAFIRAAYDGDTSELETLVHSESPNRNQLTSASTDGSVSATITSTQITSETETETTVSVETEVTSSEMDRTVDATFDVILRQENGNWRVYGVEATGF